MKNHNLILLLTLFVYACQPTKDTEKENEASVAEIKFSSAYMPPTFTTEDNRRQQIASIAPKLHQLFEEYAEKKNIPGIAYGVVVDDKLVIDSALGTINLDKQIPTSTSSSFRIASMTKSFTAMAIMKLMEDRKLSLHDPAAIYVPELKNVEYLTADSPPITVENLLTMTAGFPEDNPWGDRQLDEPDEMLQGLLNNGPSFSNPPSYVFEYSNTGYAILGMVIKNVSGQSYQNYITENILKQLGMYDTYWEYDSVPVNQLAIGYQPDSLTKAPMLHDGVYGAMGGLITSIEDFSKYVSFHLSAWPPRSEPEHGPVKRSSLRMMHQPHSPKLIAEAKDWNDEPCPAMVGYGYGLGVSENCNGTRRIAHGGALPGFGSNYVFYPELNLGLMAFCNVTYTSPWPYVKILDLLFDQLNLKAITLPASETLLKMQDELVKFITTWDSQIEKRIIAENLYLDQDKKSRMEDIDKLIDEAGAVQSIGEMKPYNQLRGSFDIYAEKDTLKVYFTLSPESNPKVQYLDVSL